MSNNQQSNECPSDKYESKIYMLKIPANTDINISMNTNDLLYITVTDECCWTDSDITNEIFPNGLLDRRDHDAHDQDGFYGPPVLTDQNSKTVTFTACKKADWGKKHKISGNSITVSPGPGQSGFKGPDK